MRFYYTTRIELGILILGIATCINMLSTAITTPLKLSSFTDDALQQFVSRYDQVKKILPPATLVGYLTDQGDKIDLTQPIPLTEFYQTQYAMAPVLVTNSVTPKYLIGSFHKDPTKQIQQYQLNIEKDFGNGVILLSHKQ